MYRKILIAGLGFCLFAVVLGAFGAHALKALVSVEKLQIFETGVRYQFLHGLALIALSLYGMQNADKMGEQKALGWAGHFFMLGTFFFSGSLYLLTLVSAGHPFIHFIGPITPLGGLCFILGWSFWVRVVFLHKVDK
jgi:uncharacterized membrane protein YgdD (TMEM256/DUF423 family)